MSAITAATFIDPTVHEATPYIMVVAGGALRDSWFDKPVNDLDVFVFHDPQVKEFYTTSDILTVELLGRSSLIFGNNPSSSLGSSSNMVVFKKETGGEYEESNFISYRSEEVPGVNIILMENYSEKGTKEERREELALDLINGFPCSISQIAWCPHLDQWWLTDQFKHTAETKEVLVDRDGLGYYHDKIAEKYSVVHWPASFKGGGMSHFFR